MTRLELLDIATTLYFAVVSNEQVEKIAHDLDCLKYFNDDTISKTEFIQASTL